MFKIITGKFSKSGTIEDQKGFTLLEVLIAVVLIGLIVTGIFAGVGTMTTVYGDTNVHEIAKDIAAGDMDYIFSQDYASTYVLPSSPTEYSGYTTSAPVITSLQKTEQQITINILFGNKIVYTLTDYRTNY